MKEGKMFHSLAVLIIIFKYFKMNYVKRMLSY